MNLIKYTEKQLVNGVPTGLLTPMYKEEVETNISLKKAIRTIAVKKLVATNSDNQSVDANEISMDRFDRVISLAMAKIMIAQDPANSIWDDTKFPWIDSDNNIIQISIKQAIELQEDGLNQLATEWLK